MTHRCRYCQLHEGHDGPHVPVDLCPFCKRVVDMCYCEDGPARRPRAHASLAQHRADEAAKAHPLDARALEARLADRDVIIGVLRDRCAKLEASIRKYLEAPQRCDALALFELAKALEVLPPVKPC